MPGAVIILYTCEKFGNFAKDPAVARFCGRYFLYHSIRIGQRIGIGIAVSDDLENWEFISELERQDNCGCEKNGIAAPAALVTGDTLNLFYQTYGNRERDAICRAVSRDGIHFERDADNPVFAPSKDWCCGRAIDADVCVIGGSLHLYFATRDYDFKIQKLGCAKAPFTSDFSDARWRSRGAWAEAKRGTILEPSLQWEGECIEAPAVFTRGGRVYMFYGGAYNCWPQQIGLAVSGDGVGFTRASESPFLANGAPGSWNASESGHPYVFEDGDDIYLFYQGSPDGGKSWYISKTRIIERDGVLVNAGC